MKSSRNLKPIKTLIITLSRTEFIEKDGKLYWKEISRKIIKGKKNEKTN